MSFEGGPSSEWDDGAFMGSTDFDCCSYLFSGARVDDGVRWVWGVEAFILAMSFQDGGDEGKTIGAKNKT